MEALEKEEEEPAGAVVVAAVAAAALAAYSSPPYSFVRPCAASRCRPQQQVAAAGCVG